MCVRTWLLTVSDEFTTGILEGSHIPLEVL